jgi:hypothetical protein
MHSKVLASLFIAVSQIEYYASAPKLQDQVNISKPTLFKFCTTRINITGHLEPQAAV